MPEPWLRTNRRILSLGFVLPTLLLIVGVAMFCLAPSTGLLSYLAWLGCFAIAGGVLTALALFHLTRVPRLAYQNGHLLVYLQSNDPIRVPIDVVECFILGQATSNLRSQDGKEVETSTIVVRLAEAAKQWHHRDVSRSLGRWCDGYIIIDGTWCEPIDQELMGQLNKRLVEKHRDVRAAAEASSS